MKTRMFGVGCAALGVAVAGLVLLAGRTQGRQSNAVLEQTAPDTVADNAASTAPAVPGAAALPPAPSTASAGQLAPSAPQPPPAGVNLSKGATDIARFAQSGIGEDVMLAYINTVNSKFNLGSDQIVYLNDLGVSGTVVKAMIQRDSAIDVMSQAAAASLAAAAQPPPPPVYTNAPVPTDDTASPPPPPVDDSTAQMPPYDPGTSVAADDSDYFYNSLAPYGNWVYVAGCGVCWRPTVCLSNHDWQPYNDRGRWLYSDCGWYWQSDYSWGWAPFHYGRWFQDPHCGWVWRPDHVWGPAWVSWRQSGEYCGWAPLPPSARYVPGHGFFYANRPAGGDCEFGLHAHHYTFIPIARMSDYAPARYAVTSGQLEKVREESRVITQVAERNHHIVYRSVDPNMVATLARTEIRRAEIQEVPHDANRPVQPERLGKSGGSLVIYRPELPAPTRLPVHSPAAGAPSSRPGHVPAMQNFGGSRTSTTPSTPFASQPATPQVSAVATVRQNSDDLVARLAALQKAAVASSRQSAATESYPPGSLVLRGGGSPNPASPSVRPETAWQPSTLRVSSSGSQSARMSGGGYTTVNGFVRPNDAQQPVAFQHPVGRSQAALVISGRVAGAQHVNGNPLPYWMAPAQVPANTHSEWARENTSHIAPAHYTVAERLNPSIPSVSQAGGMATYSTQAHSHFERTMEAPIAPTHFESHETAHAAPAPAAHESSSSSSHASSSGGSSWGRK